MNVFAITHCLNSGIIFHAMEKTKHAKTLQCLVFNLLLKWHGDWHYVTVNKLNTQPL